jgi:hypothetical protein
MSKRWLIILLLISAAFNLAVVGSFIYLQSTRPPHHPREWHHRGPDSRRGHDGPGPRFMFTDSTRALHASFQDTKRDLMLELAKDPVDKTRIEAIISGSLSAQAKLERDLAERLIRFRSAMTPDEAREHFTRRAEEIERDKTEKQDYKRSRRQRR